QSLLSGTPHGRDPPARIPLLPNFFVVTGLQRLGLRLFSDFFLDLVTAFRNNRYFSCQPGTLRALTFYPPPALDAGCAIFAQPACWLPSSVDRFGSLLPLRSTPMLRAVRTAKLHSCRRSICWSPKLESLETRVVPSTLPPSFQESLFSSGLVKP